MEIHRLKDTYGTCRSFIMYGLHMDSGWLKVLSFFIPWDGSNSAWLSLASFKTILLDAVISSGIKKKKKTWKLVNVSVAILILKMEEKNIFSACASSFQER